jgi:hypothetical protein
METTDTTLETRIVRAMEDAWNDCAYDIFQCVGKSKLRRNDVIDSVRGHRVLLGSSVPGRPHCLDTDVGQAPAGSIAARLPRRLVLFLISKPTQPKGQHDNAR